MGEWVQTFFPPWMGKHPGFICKRENSSWGLRQGPGKSLSGWRLCFEWLCPRWGHGDSALGLSQAFFLLPSRWIYQGPHLPTAWDRSILKSLPWQVPPPREMWALTQIQLQWVRQLLTSHRPLQQNLGRGGSGRLVGKGARKDISKSHLSRCRESIDKVQHLFMIEKKSPRKLRLVKNFSAQQMKLTKNCG